MKLAVVGLLPYPDDVDDIVSFLKPMLSMPIEGMWKGKTIQPGFIVGYLRKHKTVKPKDSYYYEIFNQHLFLRSCHQANEACNKIRATCELYHHADKHSDDLLSASLIPGFLPSSTVSTLYYGAVSSVLSILGFFGVGSYRMSEEGKDFDVIRAEKGFRLVDRGKHVKSLTGDSGRGWHQRIFLLYEGLSKRGIRLPPLNLRSLKELQTARFQFDYDILTKASMKDTYGPELFFKHLPCAMQSTRVAICNLKRLSDPLFNGCDARFTELAKSVLPLGQKYLKGLAPYRQKLDDEVKTVLMTV